MANEKTGCLASFLHLFGLGKKHAPGSISGTRAGDEPVRLPYLIRDDFLSESEASFYHVLKTAISGSLTICPKVSLGDIFYVSRPDINVAYRNKIDRKHIDFLLCDASTMKPVLGIELDDSSHARPERASRDEFIEEVFSTTGLPLVRISARRAYITQEINELITSKIQSDSQQLELDEPSEPAAWTSDAPPTCPKCGSHMILRTAKKGSKAGQQFYGCTNYPQRKQIISVSNVRKV